MHILNRITLVYLDDYITSKTLLVLMNYKKKTSNYLQSMLFYVHAMLI